MKEKLGKKRASVAFAVFLFMASLVVSAKTVQAQEYPRDVMQGRWSYVTNMDSYYDYLPTGEVVEVIKKDGVCYTNSEDGPVLYRLEEKNDTLFLIHRYKQRMVNNENILGYEERWSIRISGDYMEIFGFKGRKGITNHISSGCGVRVRHIKGTPHRCDVGMPLTIYMLPQNFRGHVAVAFGQPDGVAPEYDARGNRIVRIPPSGLLKTQLKEDAFGTAGGRYRVMIPDSTTQVLAQLPVFNSFENDSSAASPNTLVVIMQRFNWFPREELNMLFGKPMSGNILLFYVNRFKEANNSENGYPWFYKRD